MKYFFRLVNVSEIDVETIEIEANNVQDAKRFFLEHHVIINKVK